MTFDTLFVSSNGRLGRRDFWIGVVFMAIVVVAYWYVGRVLMIGYPLLLLALFALLGKRLHDMGQSAWLAAVPVGLGLVAFYLRAQKPALPMAPMATDAALAVGVVMILWCGLANGQSGENKYGAPAAA